ncbi:MAG TPA: M28 family peptidase [Gemmatimonadales bacterium]|nr:M28 family peptidase [Gemmatimonadales bacterium]
MQAVRRLLGVAMSVVIAAPAAAQTALPLKHTPARTQTAITPADLMTRLYLYSDDSMMGRLAGSAYDLKATAYVASEFKRLGLRPAGDSGGYFQNVPLVKRQLDPNASFSVDGTSFRPWDEFFPRDPGVATHPFDATQAIYGGVWPDSTLITADQAAGKFVVLGAHTGPNVTPQQGINRGAMLARYRTAAGIAVVALESFPPGARNFFRQPATILKDAAASDTTTLPVYLYVTSAGGRTLLGAPIDSLQPGALGKTVHGSISFNETPAPARNVVAILSGSDPKLRGQYVALGAHNDHIGFNNNAVDHDSIRAFNDDVRKLVLAAPTHRVSPDQVQQIHVNVDSLHRLHAARRDSIYNGADDDGSGTVALLEIAEAFAGAKGTARPKRSLIFVSHTGEELGLFGSQYFTDHPTVPRDSIDAQLNMDMIGRGRADDENGGGPGYLQLIGTRRLSTELGDVIETVNKQRKQPFTFDYQFDAAGHPEQYYCRSDHYMYARYGIPIAFFTTGNHRDYHQVTDEPEYIDYEKLAHVSQFVYDIATAVANLDHRVVVDKPKPDPHGNCVQ